LPWWGLAVAAKSTIAKLIARLYDAQNGAVFIDGMDVRNVRLESLRTRVCYVMQEGILFDRTLRENVLLGKPTATTKELRVANRNCRPRAIDPSNSPRAGTRRSVQEETLYLEAKNNVLLWLAQCCSDPSLLLLDESTSALDVPSERRIFASLANYFSKETIIFISHRISALNWVDRIVVLSHGVVEDRGYT